ncbi:L-fucose:H+ symporter permease [Stenotrophomonas sp. ESTM1D_MKCIP4_1]|uniref:L-fucose:H+ symporter permease n=1 Tax=Stenotrophomonas sp. ESTM1D_MKCIP4_1 TaxID=2072414 RepID=UPI000D542A12|nr:L-fucose:H+ symporter permease [Stenotrophomonas sp. ESTM1D_MKCIP4_1]AWH53322.1 L-fucose:H+ symporter permease [Stenotrophomonas sp. ESTM1D_MKCIP4_1]
MPISATPRPSGSNSSQAPVMNARAALWVATTIFFMWGFLTSLNDVLIPHLKAVFELNYTRAMLVQFTFFGAYFLMSVPAGRLVARLGYKKGIIAGLLIASVGALGFWPSAALRTYDAFLASLFVLATGITVLQVAANPYVALLGPEKTASSRLTLAQALNSLGTTLAPMFGGFLILSTAVKSGDEIKAMPVAEQLAYRAAEAQSVQGPYVGLAIALVLLAVFVFLFRLPSLTESTEQADTSHHTLLDALKHPHVLFGVLAIFFYVGAEVSIGSLMVNYLALPEIGGMSEAQATWYVSMYWGGAMIGRFAGAWLLAKYSPRRLLAGFALANVVLLAVTLGSGGKVALYGIVATGLFNSIMFPTIFSLAIERLGPLTNKASSLLIMAIVGGAIIPLLQGMLADRIGLHLSFVLPVVCYVYIIFYGLVGSRPPAVGAQGG